MTKLVFKSNKYGTWESEGRQSYYIEKSGAVYFTFLGNTRIGPGFKHLKSAIDFCEGYNHELTHNT